MSESTNAGRSGPDVDGWPRHETTNADLRLDDLSRVTTAEQVVDRATVIAKWHFSQADFDPERHPEIPTKVNKYTDLTGNTETTHEKVKIDGTARRTTLATEDGGRYAVVDWIATDDPPFLYLLVIDSEEPEDRRWDSIGPVERVERYGPEPQYQMTGFQRVWSRDARSRVLSLALDGTLSDTDAGADLPDPGVVQSIADRVSSDGSSRYTREELETLSTAFTAASEYVERTGEPILTNDPEDDLSKLDKDFNPGYHIALFPDGSGGWIERYSRGGPPSEDVPPWEVEQDADPTFTPLGGDGGG